MISYQAFGAAIRAAQTATGRSGAHDLKGILFDFYPMTPAGADLSIVGTNRQRIVSVGVGLKHGMAAPATFFMADETISELVSWLANETSSLRVSIYLIGGQLMVLAGGKTFTATSTPVDFPADYRKFFVPAPAEAGHTRTVFIDYLLDVLYAVKRVSNGYMRVDAESHLHIRVGVARDHTELKSIDIAVTTTKPEYAMLLDGGAE